MDIKPGWAQTRSTSETGDAQILNVALALEHQAIAAYGVGAKSGLLKGGVLKLALQFRGQHEAHAEALQGAIRGMGARAVKPKSVEEYHFPVNTLHNQADVLRFAASLEKAAAMAYLGTVPEFHNRGLAKTAASIMGDETMHWAVLRDALGKNPVPISFI
jgi:rubrerythrin